MMDPHLQEKHEQVEKFLKMRGLVALQENGQRIVYPLEDLPQGIDLARGTEVFIGRIPRDIFEDELLPIFERAGPVYKFRLMMDFSGTNRGFGFAQYTNRVSALNAINLLDQYEIRQDTYIGVVESLDNCRLCLNNFPSTVTAEAIKKELSRVTIGVKEVIVPREGQKNGRLHAIVEYESHRCATMARRYLVPGDHIMFNRKIEVDWAKPDVAQDVRSVKSATLYIGNLNRSISKNLLQQVLSLSGYYPLVSLEYVTETSIFVTYKARQHATDIFEVINTEKHIFQPIAADSNSAVSANWATTSELASFAITQLINIDTMDKTSGLLSPLAALSIGGSTSSSESSPSSSSSQASHSSSQASKSPPSASPLYSNFIDPNNNNSYLGVGHMQLLSL